MSGRALIPPPGVERRDDAHDAFFADLHGAPDTEILEQAGCDQCATPGKDTGGERPIVLVRTGDNKIGPGTELIA